MIIGLINWYNEENNQCVRVINDIRNMLIQIEHVPNELITSMNNLIKMYRQIILRNNEKITALTDKINSLEGVEADIMKLRYIEGLAWQDIADKLYISVATAHRYYNKAIKKIQEE